MTTRPSWAETVKYARSSDKQLGWHWPHGSVLFCAERLAEAVRSWRGWKPIHDDPQNEELQYSEYITVREGHPVRRLYYHPAWFPVAKDGGGNAWAIDLDPPAGGVRGQIIQMRPDEDERRVIANSLTELFFGAARFMDPDNVHVSDCCGPRLSFEMDWKEPPGPLLQNNGRACSR